jgi:hypothetical protein
MYNEEERIFFHVRQTLEPLSPNDIVIFEVGHSRKDPAKSEAFYVRKAYAQPNALDLALANDLAVTSDALDFLLKEMINEICIKDDPKEQIVITKAFPNHIGASLAVETTLLDDVFYATRHRRRGYYRFVKNRRPEPTNLFTVIIDFVPSEQFYEVTTCYFGNKTPPAPWDKRATPDAVPFWKNHALIPHETFAINDDSEKEFDPDFFKSFEELQETRKN